MKFCINCGKKIPKKNKFCPYCGANQKRNNKAKSQHQKSLNGITYTTDDDTKKKSALSAKPGQQTWNDFYSKHRIPVIITSIVCIILVLIFGLKFAFNSYHNYEYPTDKLPPSIANTKQSFNGGVDLVFHKGNFDYDPSSDVYHYKVDRVAYNGDTVSISCHCTSNDQGNADDQDSDYTYWQLKVKNGTVENEKPSGLSNSDPSLD